LITYPNAAIYLYLSNRVTGKRQEVKVGDWLPRASQCRITQMECISWSYLPRLPTQPLSDRHWLGTILSIWISIRPLRFVCIDVLKFVLYSNQSRITKVEWWKTLQIWWKGGGEWTNEVTITNRWMLWG
jgi:hypothetical protein